MGNIRLDPVLGRWNELPREEAAAKLLSCCGSRRWAEQLALRRPYSERGELLKAAREVWYALEPEDWMEAFRSHPRIGERHAERATTAASAAWSAAEQKSVQDAEESTRRAIARGNRLYEERFGRIFIICAAGKQPSEILEILTARLANSDEAELQESAAQQALILELRLEKWLSA